MDIRKLKNIVVRDETDLDVLVAGLAELRLLNSEYEALGGYPTPRWITEKISTVEREVKERARDLVLAAIKREDSLQESLATAKDKRAASAARADTLRKQLEELS